MVKTRKVQRHATNVRQWLKLEKYKDMTTDVRQWLKLEKYKDMTQIYLQLNSKSKKINKSRKFSIHCRFTNYQSMWWKPAFTYLD